MMLRGLPSVVGLFKDTVIVLASHSVSTLHVVCSDELGAPHRRRPEVFVHFHKCRAPTLPVRTAPLQKTRFWTCRLGTSLWKPNMKLLVASLTASVSFPQDEQWEEHCDQRHALGQSSAFWDWPHHQLLPAGGGHRWPRGLPPHGGLRGEEEHQGEGAGQGLGRTAGSHVLAHLSAPGILAGESGLRPTTRQD